MRISRILMRMTQTIAFAADHAGYLLKDQLLRHAQAQGFEVLDLGTTTADSVDYPDYARKMRAAIESGES